MRDTHGRYSSIKEIAANGPSWASGCPNCAYGIAAAPDLTGAVSMHLERVVQMIGAQLTFCQCKAGVRAEANLRNVRQKLIEEARRDGRMQEHAKRLTHPDIDAAQRKVTDYYLNAPAPSVHLEPEPVTA